ncbi:hypothetical protein K1T71_001496 [Dendrolimus kikuchii]|uniref:Uncharacterized protein n=1 Tax=Dendrolimus kikuchii TaxID=765133 RepID=A0ACC1DIA2_9NEOP|nr:hypothetical protein K1T71_001496 [Dendrolimus kikuchii]
MQKAYEAVVAEPPLYRRNLKFERQELGSEQGSNNEAPYAPAGYRPAKEFKLPSRQGVSPPATSYGIPDNSYSAPVNTYLTPEREYGLPEPTPDTEYGVPENREEKIDDNDENEEDLKVEGVKENLAEADKDSEVISSKGAYFVLLPNNQLQRVQFQTENDLRNMAYTARLQYRNEERAPVYVYTAVPQYQPSAAYVQVF